MEVQIKTLKLVLLVIVFTVPALILIAPICDDDASDDDTAECDEAARDECLL